MRLEMRSMINHILPLNYRYAVKS